MTTLAPTARSDLSTGMVAISSFLEEHGIFPSIALCDAQAEQNFMGVQGGYVTYRVNTQMSLPTYPRSGSAVRRRFRDFVVRCSVTPSLHSSWRARAVYPLQAACAMRAEENPLERDVWDQALEDLVKTMQQSSLLHNAPQGNS